MKAPIPRTGEQTEAIRAAVVSMGARAEGFRCREVENLGFTQSAVTCVIARYLKSGLLHRARISHRVIVYFTDARAAMQREAEVMTTPPAAPKSKRGAPWPKDAQPHFPRNKDGSPAWKTTIAPTPVQAIRTNTHQSY